MLLCRLAVLLISLSITALISLLTRPFLCLLLLLPVEGRPCLAARRPASPTSGFFISPGRAVIISCTLDLRNPLSSSAAAPSRPLSRRFRCAAPDVMKGHEEKGSRKRSERRRRRGTRRLSPRGDKAPAGDLSPSVFLIYRVGVKCTSRAP